MYHYPVEITNKSRPSLRRDNPSEKSLPSEYSCEVYLINPDVYRVLALYDIRAAEAIIESAGLIIVISGSARIIDISCIE